MSVGNTLSWWILGTCCLYLVHHLINIVSFKEIKKLFDLIRFHFNTLCQGKIINAQSVSFYKCKTCLPNICLSKTTVLSFYWDSSDMYCKVVSRSMSCLVAQMIFRLLTYEGEIWSLFTLTVWKMLVFAIVAGSTVYCLHVFNIWIFISDPSMPYQLWAHLFLFDFKS